MRSLTIILLVALSACAVKNPHVQMETSLGNIRIELYEKHAPVTVHNFTKLVNQKLFDGAEFYRVVTMQNQPSNKIKIEVIQGGIEYINRTDTFPGILHESTVKTGILHEDGTISMARDKPGSASTEFFICLGKQAELDFGGKRNPDGQGFAAFGKVISGMEIVRKIQSMPADSNQLLKNKVRILKMEIY